MTDVAQRRRAQQGVHDGMSQHICITVPEQPLFMGNVYAADDAFASLYQTVYVISVSNSHAFLPFSIASPIRISSGVVILIFS